MALADNFLDFSYLTTWSELYTWSFFPYDFLQTQVLTEYSYPQFSLVESLTTYWMDPWLNSSDYIVAWSQENLTSQIFCEALGAVLDTYTLTTVWTGVWFNETTNHWEEYTNTQTYSSISCLTQFDHIEFQSQQMYDIKQFVFFGLLLALMAFGVSLLKTFIFSRENV